MDKIYTKTGDKGTTSNFLGKQFSKGDMEIELQGGIDEINAMAGHLRSILKFSGNFLSDDGPCSLEDNLREIQYHLYKIGIEIATEFSEVHVSAEEVVFLENLIDNFVAATKPMDSFIYYSGSYGATYAHVTRAVVRRVERVFVRFLQDKDYPECYLYINRLSDFFFALARYLNAKEGLGDERMILR